MSQKHKAWSRLVEKCLFSLKLFGTGTRARWEGKGTEIEPKTISVSTTKSSNHYRNVVFLTFENVWMPFFPPQEFLSLFFSYMWRDRRGNFPGLSPGWLRTALALGMPLSPLHKQHSDLTQPALSTDPAFPNKYFNKRELCGLLV